MIHKRKIETEFLGRDYELEVSFGVDNCPVNAFEARRWRPEVTIYAVDMVVQKAKEGDIWYLGDGNPTSGPVYATVEMLPMLDRDQVAEIGEEVEEMIRGEYKRQVVYPAAA